MDNFVDKFNFITNKSNIFNIYAYVPLGSIYEKEGQYGISHLMEHMMMKKTKNYRNTQLYKNISLIGGNSNAGTSKDVTYYYIKTNIENYKLACKLLKDVILEPVFTTTDLEKEKKIVIEEYNQREDNMDSLLDELATLSVLDYNNPYSRTVRGEIEHIKGITVKDLRNYFLIAKKKFILVINCDIKYINEVKDYIYNKFGSNKHMNFYDNQFAESANLIKPRIMISNAGKNVIQYTTYITFKSFPNYMIKELIHLNFVKYILTNAGFNSLLFIRVREERGLVYYISSYNEDYRYTGLFKIYYSSSNKNTVYIVSLILSTLKQLCKFGLSDKQLEYFKTSFINRTKYLFTDESIKDMWYGNNLFYQTNITKDMMIQEIEKLSNNDLKKICKTLFDMNQVGIVSYGNYSNPKKIENELKNTISTYNIV